MSWNYRVLEFYSDHEHLPGPYWQIHEVYYNEDGSLRAYTTDPITIHSNEGVEELRETLKKMERALEEPVLKPSEFPGD